MQTGKRSEIWKKKTTMQLKDSLKDAQCISSSFTKDEICIICECLSVKCQAIQIGFKRHWPKHKLVNVLSKAISDGSVVEPKVRRKNFCVPPLKQLAVKVLKGRKVPKTILNIAYAQYIYPSRYEEWKRKSTVGVECKVQCLDKDINWYSYPERNIETGELLCKCLDSHHLLTNLRVKTSTTGLQNISAEAWKRVARSYVTDLTPAMVEDLVDKQSNAYAQTHFSEPVEMEMVKNGDMNEAQLCRLVRRWYEAEDDAAISATDRIDRWLDFKEYMLKDVDFGVMPPPTQFVKGFSTIAFEGFLTGIDTKLQLYALCGSYCVRTASSLPAETCVGGIQDMNVNNTPSVKAKDVPRIMSSLAELMTYKCNPRRGFHMKTSRTAVYPIVEGEQEVILDITNASESFTRTSSIVLRDHPFDVPARRRTKVRRKLGTLTSDLDAPPKGTVPLRLAFHKCDESKVLPRGRTLCNDSDEEQLPTLESISSP